MIGTKLHWIDGPWPGKLAIAARPRGGDWLDDEMAAWNREGTSIICSLLTPGEEADLGLENEETIADVWGLGFLRLPIPDREVPKSEIEFGRTLAGLDADLAAARNVVVHCRQGIGRSGLVAALLLVGRGVVPNLAVQRVSAARGVPVPETRQQREWIDHYAATISVPQHE